jgi:GxxExxY protein
MRVGTAKALDPALNEISRKIVDAAFVVHRNLGPGLLESVYRECMIFELHERGLNVRSEVDVPVTYRGRTLVSTLRLDLLVEDQVIVELKAIEGILAVHRAQLLSYLKLANKRLGLLINFNEVLVKNGISRIVN